jgi:hypothetical protein
MPSLPRLAVNVCPPMAVCALLDLGFDALLVELFACNFRARPNGTLLAILYIKSYICVAVATLWSNTH